MAKVKKFGAIAGVFTPSILTILGVIMYLRLGWVIGEGGLLLTLAIIIISHIISVSTGLSISSIATDKKIKTGGIYYILSRSLGMAMGGAIGIALFIGTALSISLYIVGFTENFLSIEPIANFLGMTGSVANIRIVGTMVIIALIALALTSTSLVIKTQYFILAAIFLSLVSIVIGFFMYVPAETETVLFKPSSNDVSFELLFAVFFPAVTGFTAGVAMSGDLKNPAKDIPFGTLASIIVGFFVYIFLAIGIAIFIDRDLLINNSNFLMTIAWFSPLVVMGIWGATLSSALGGILGGPRILQAIANDKIMPSFLGKGYGVNNEPRNALLFIFIIAEMGILIGDLNMIAGIVSMFYLASYGFINLAYALESFASTDFRPSFRISKWFGIIGFVASFAVMFKMDATAMTMALVIMIGIYLILKRKELKSDFGDVWISVWNSIARSALHKMNKNKIEDRNWQPNILLFSGSTLKRPHLVEFGKNLVGNFGVLSNFDLIENKSAEYLFPKHEQSITNGENEPGIFYRRQSCKDIYQGIEIIASTYGFSGMEPNTVLMGWAKQSAKPEKFVNLIKSLYELDLNVLLMDYDKKLGFGKKASIDIWWRGEGLNNNLALFLTKFLMSSPEWENASLRLISISEFDHQGEQLHKKASYVLEALRIDANIIIINNQYNKRSVFDIIREESVDTDLIYMGLPNIEKGNEQKFVEATNRLLELTGTIVLVKASSFFQKMIFIPKHLLKIPKLNIASNIVVIEKTFEKISTAHNLKHETSDELKNLFIELKNLAEFFTSKYIEPATLNYTTTQKEGLTEIKKLFLENKEKNKNKAKQLYFDHLDQLNEFANHTIDSLYNIAETNKEAQEKGISQYQAEIIKMVKRAKKTFQIQYERNEINSITATTRSEKNVKRRLEVKKNFGGKAKLKINHKKILANQLEFLSNINLYGYFAAWFSMYFESLASMKDLFGWFRFSLPPLSELSNNKNNKAFGFTQDQKKDLELKLIDSFNANELLSAYPTEHIPDISSKVINDLATLYSKPDVNAISTLGSKQKQEVGAFKDRVSQLTEFWQKGYIYFLNELKLENALTKVTIHLYDIVYQLIKELQQLIEISLYDNINKLLLNVDLAIDCVDNQLNTDDLNMLELQISDADSIRMLFNEIKEQWVLNLKTLHDFVPDKSEISENFSISGLFSKKQSFTTQRILSKKLVEELIANDIIAEVYSLFDLLSKKVVEFDNEIINHNRLIGYSIDNESGMQVVFSEKISDMKSFLRTKKVDIEELKQESESLNSLMVSRLEKSYDQLNGKLQLFNFKKEADSWNQFLPKTQTIRGISSITRFYNDFKIYFDKQLEQFWHKQSKAILLANSLSSNKSELISPLNKLVKLTSALSIKPEIKQHLPFYYKHLFLNKDFYNTDFWFGRKDELTKAENAWHNFKLGVSGALIILGERNSGKSFFIHKFISSYVKETKVVLVKAHSDGQANLKSFNSALRKATGINGDNDKIFKKLDEKTILVFDDIELWWQKTNNGSLIIKLLHDLISKFGHKTFFVLSQNIHSYKIMNQIVPLATLSVDIINLKPFNSELLQKTILFRHNSAGIKFKITESDKKKGTVEQEDLKPKNYARIFHKFFTISRGNVGMALSYWISNIVNYDGEEMQIQLPSKADSEVLNLLTIDQLILLTQLVWHKSLTNSQLADILMDKDFAFSTDLNFLKRCGIIIQNAEILEINSFVYMQIVEKLERDRFI